MLANGNGAIWNTEGKLRRGGKWNAQEPSGKHKCPPGADPGFSPRAWLCVERGEENQKTTKDA